jgi:hypothetical protein
MDESRLIACPECGAPAEVVPQGWADSTDGPVELVRVWCVERHWFMLAADSLPAAVEQARPIASRPR